MHLPSPWVFCTEVAVLGQWEGTCHAETLRGGLRLLQVAASLRGSPLDPLSGQPQVMAMIQDAQPEETIKLNMKMKMNIAIRIRMLPPVSWYVSAPLEQLPLYKYRYGIFIIIIMIILPSLMT
jgi:hypothetical protein